MYSSRKDKRKPELIDRELERERKTNASMTHARTGTEENRTLLPSWDMTLSVGSESVA